MTKWGTKGDVIKVILIKEFGTPKDITWKAEMEWWDITNRRRMQLRNKKRTELYKIWQPKLFGGLPCL